MWSKCVLLNQTVSARTPGISDDGSMLFSECNKDCSCSAREWEPVCSENGITYMSPCLAGCSRSTGYGKHTVFHNCSCVSSSPPPGGSMSVTLGQCPRTGDCSRSFTSYMAVSVLSSFINSLGTTPGYMVIIRCIKPELKSLALGIQTLVMRTLGGIPAPVYFGALIDSTCLNWGVKKCGGRGACRMYDSDMYRVIFLGLITCLSGSSYFFIIIVIILLRRQFRKEGGKAQEQPNAQREIELQTHKAPDQPDSQLQTPKDGEGDAEGEHGHPLGEEGKPLPTQKDTEGVQLHDTQGENPNEPLRNHSQSGEEMESQRSVREEADVPSAALAGRRKEGEGEPAEQANGQSEGEALLQPQRESSNPENHLAEHRHTEGKAEGPQG